MKCFYHISDFDGKCSAAIINMRYPKCEFIGIDYSHKFDFNKINSKNEMIFMVDFSLDIKSMNLLSEKCHLIWIDHHETIINDAVLNDFNPLGIRKIGKGACELVWNYIYEDSPVPLFVKYLADYDVWKLYENVFEFQYGLRIEDYSITELSNLIQSSIKDKKIINNIIENGKLIIKYEDNQNKLFKHICFNSDIEFLNQKYKAICINAPFGNSQKFKHIINDNHDLMCVFNFNGTSYKVSLYTEKDNIDCGKIAKYFGGGGHRQAAGFITSNLNFLKNIKRS